MSASDLHRLQDPGGPHRPGLRGTILHKAFAVGLWLAATLGLFQIVSWIDLFDRLYALTRAYEVWELDEALALILCAGVVSFVLLGLRTRQLSREIARREAAERLAHESARHDPLTGLANGRRFHEVLKTAIGQAQQESSYCATLYIDLDGFKPINDKHGHAAGDSVLVEVAQRISQATPRGATVARLGGDEFGIVLPVVAGRESLLFLAQRLSRDIAKPQKVKGLRVVVDASIGTAIYPDDAEEAEALIHAADLAMYQGKKAKRSASALDGQVQRSARAAG